MTIKMILENITRNHFIMAIDTRRGEFSWRGVFQSGRKEISKNVTLIMQNFRLVFIRGIVSYILLQSNQFVVVLKTFKFGTYVN